MTTQSKNGGSFHINRFPMVFHRFPMVFPYKSPFSHGFPWFSHGFPMVFPSLERPALASVQRTTGLSRPARRRSSPGSQGEKPPELRKKSETPKMEKRNHLPARPEEKKPQVPPGKGRHFGDGHRICV